MKLYHHPISGHAHRARLMLSLLGLDHELVVVDLMKRENKSPEFLELNPFGQIPVLDDNGTIIPDSNSILVYLAKKERRTDWLPEDPTAAAAVQRWLSVAAGDIAFGPGVARLINLIDAPFNKEEVIARAHGIFAKMEAELDGRDWVASKGAPTIADVSLYSYIFSAPEGDVSLEDYPRIRAWLERVEALPGFVAFQRTPVGLAA